MVLVYGVDHVMPCHAAATALLPLCVTQGLPGVASELGLLVVLAAVVEGEPAAEARQQQHWRGAATAAQCQPG